MSLMTLYIGWDRAVRTQTARFGLGGLFALLVFPGLAAAGGGEFELNQVCAVQTGCLPGDGPGYPITLNASHSYRLTGNLVIPENTDGISVQAPGVTIDLGGFGIVRSGCETATADCTPTSGSGTGVRGISFGPGVIGTAVRNGTVAGMAGHGVRVGPNARVTGLQVLWNRQGGIEVQNHSVVSGNVIYENGGNGIESSGAGVTVSNNVATRNTGIGILVFSGSTVTDNVAHANGGTGIETGIGSTVVRSLASSSGSRGISVDPGSTVVDSLAASSSSDGIDAGSGSLVNGCSVSSSGGYGLNLSTGAAYRANFLTSNTSGNANGGLNMGDNICGFTSCP